MQQKDIHRYSHSRISTYKQCPMKHHYTYVEQIETPETQSVIPGKMFHECVEAILTGQDTEPIFQEFRKLCTTGKLDYEPDLLEYIVSLYFQYYKSDYALEETVMVEKEFKEDLEDNDYLTLIVDQAFYKNGMLTVRDLKTSQSKFKYDYDSVQYNSQLLLYLPFIEAELHEKVSAIQIDEIRLAKLKPVPLRANGKPSTDKKLLDFVTYEDYRNLLEEMDLQDDKEYQAIQDYLKQRGHPLFKRTTSQITDQAVIDENALEVVNVYHIIKDSIKQFESNGKHKCYRNKSTLCNWCPFKDLCQLDFHNPGIATRNMMIEKIKK